MGTRGIMGVFRKNLLEYLNAEETIIISATDGDIDFLINNFLFKEGTNLFDVYKMLDKTDVGYFTYIEKKYGLDIIGRESMIDVNSLSVDARKYAVSRSMSIPELAQYIHDKYKGFKILDIGCGKAGAMIAMNDFNCSDVIDGIELLEKFCAAGRNNLRKLNYQGSIECADSSKFANYHDYDLFYMYDPFRGDTFEKVIRKLADSYRIKKRKMVIVYAVPWMHRKIVKGKIFRFVDQLYQDWFTRMVNIYETE